MKTFVKNVTALVQQKDSMTEASTSADLLINYNNIDKVSQNCYFFSSVAILLLSH